MTGAGQGARGEAYRERHDVGARPHVSGLGAGLGFAKGGDRARNWHKGAVDYLMSVFGIVLDAQK